jgi:hypothetical protein
VHNTALVGIRECLRDVAQHTLHHLNGKRAFLAEPRSQGLAFHKRHGVEGHPRCFAGGQNGNDVGLL